MQPTPGGPVVARALTTVIEGRRAGDSTSGEPEMHVRIMIENRGDAPVRLAEDGMKLIGSGLEQFGAPRVEPAPGEEIPPAQSRTYELHFPYPAGMDLSAPELQGLNLSWSIGYSGGIADVTQSFVRRIPATGYYEESGVHWNFFFSTSHHM